MNTGNDTKKTDERLFALEGLMKFRTRIFGIAALVFFTASISSCVFLEKKKMLPPGQEKKLTGQQNASSLAPGKNK